MAQNPKQVIARVTDPIKPETSAMNLEPARTVGELFANKAMIQPVVAAVVAMVAGITGWAVDDSMVTNITTIVLFVAVLWGGISAQVGASKRAMEQAEATRDVVYSPATVEKVVQVAKRT